MSLSDLFNILNSIEGFEGRVTYRAFPEGESPGLPFICYLEDHTENFKADSSVYKKRTVVNIELYTKYKDIDSETLVENALNSNCIVWDKDEEYIGEEHCYEIIYEITI